MDVILQEKGLTEGTVAQRIRILGDDPNLTYRQDKASIKQYIDDFNAILSNINAGLGSAFNFTVTRPLDVVPYPKFSEGTMVAAHYEAPPPLAPSVPAHFYVNTVDMSNIRKFEMHTLAYHEGIPGHHLQMSIADEQGSIPLFVRAGTFTGLSLDLTGYREGWACYAEQLAYEMGYEKNSMDNLGRLNYELLRAARLVVDTGMNHKHWTRQQAIGYLRDVAGRPEQAAAIEVERYLIWPGQALAYKVGMREMLRLRAKAQQKLGDSFDLKKFHDVVILNGAVPFSTLSNEVDKYIDDTLHPTVAK